MQRIVTDAQTMLLYSPLQWQRTLSNTNTLLLKYQCTVVFQLLTIALSLNRSTLRQLYQNALSLPVVEALFYAILVRNSEMINVLHFRVLVR